MLPIHVKLSSLWIMVVLNIICADILSFISPGFMAELVTGGLESNVVTHGLLLAIAVLLEIPIAMIFLSRILPQRSNRISNLVAGIITIVFVIGGGSPTPHYIFFASIEVICLLIIMQTAFSWKESHQ